MSFGLFLIGFDLKFHQYFIKRKLPDLFSNIDYYLVKTKLSVMTADTKLQLLHVYLRRHRLYFAASTGTVAASL